MLVSLAAVLDRFANGLPFLQVSLLHSLRSNNSTNNPEILSKVYSDVALYNYSVNRSERYRKKAMKTYTIFWDCILGK